MTSLMLDCQSGASERLIRILSFEEDVSKIVRKKADGSEAEHLLGRFSGGVAFA